VSEELAVSWVRSVFGEDVEDATDLTEERTP